MNDSEWAANQCDVELDPDGTWEDSVTGYLSPWTLDDARCREIVCEHFKIGTTEHASGLWWSAPNRLPHIKPTTGKSIKESQINCIKAIREAQA